MKGHPLCSGSESARERGTRPRPGGRKVTAVSDEPMSRGPRAEWRLLGHVVWRRVPGTSGIHGEGAACFNIGKLGTRGAQSAWGECLEEEEEGTARDATITVNDRGAYSTDSYRLTGYQALLGTGPRDPQSTPSCYCPQIWDRKPRHGEVR